MESTRCDCQHFTMRKGWLKFRYGYQVPLQNLRKPTSPGVERELQNGARQTSIFSIDERGQSEKGAINTYKILDLKSSPLGVSYLWQSKQNQVTTKNVASTTSSSSDGRKKTKYRPGFLALKEIRRYQRSTELGLWLPCRREWKPTYVGVFKETD